jgi:hypothetical protein
LQTRYTSAVSLKCIAAIIAVQRKRKTYSHPKEPPGVTG